MRLGLPRRSRRRRKRGGAASQDKLDKDGPLTEGTFEETVGSEQLFGLRPRNSRKAAKGGNSDTDDPRTKVSGEEMLMKAGGLIVAGAALSYLIPQLLSRKAKKRKSRTR